jgi:hypothetical protein
MEILTRIRGSLTLKLHAECSLVKVTEDTISRKTFT